MIFFGRAYPCLCGRVWNPPLRRGDWGKKLPRNGMEPFRGFAMPIFTFYSAALTAPVWPSTAKRQVSVSINQAGVRVRVPVPLTR